MLLKELVVSVDAFVHNRMVGGAGVMNNRMRSASLSRASHLAAPPLAGPGGQEGDHMRREAEAHIRRPRSRRIPRDLGADQPPLYEMKDPPREVILILFFCK